MALCTAITVSGERCSNRATNGSEWCSAHDPARAEARKEAARKAGRARHNKATRELLEVKQRLSDLADAVLLGTVDRGRAAVAAQVLNTYLRAAEIERKWHETDDLLVRLERLEAEAARIESEELEAS